VRLLKKIGQILNNPSIGTPKRHKLKHARGSHVNPYVIVYRSELPCPVGRGFPHHRQNQASRTCDVEVLIRLH